MTHFTVLVVTDDQPDLDQLERILQPWHEYECTGIDDEYVVDVDVTEDVIARLNENADAVRLADGSLKDRADEMFWQSPAGHGNPEFVLPSGACVVTLPRSELITALGKTIEQWALDFGGWTPDGNGGFCVRTNPNALWDWWVVGGRWSGFLRIKPGAQRIVGSPGAFGPMRDANIYADCACLSDIDVAAMRADAAAEAGQFWDTGSAAAAGHPRAESWEQILDAFGPDGARKAYWSQPMTKALLQAFPQYVLDVDEQLDAIAHERTDWCEKAKAHVLVTHAFVKDGQWHEAGQMGWFGISKDDMSRDDWNTRFSAMIDSLPPSAWLILVDCHI